MAVTTLVTRSNRYGPRSFLYNSVGGVAADATIGETFLLPVGYGSLMIESIGASISQFSGAYVAPAPAYDGAEITILSPDAATRVDIVGSTRFVHSTTVSARPELSVSFDLNNGVLVRRDERIVVQAPILAGAGVTVVVTLFVRGIRFETS